MQSVLGVASVMAGNGPAPKPDADRRRRNSPTFDWVRLPSGGRPGKPPELPKFRKWHSSTVAAWADWWSSPQATAWDQTGRSLIRWAILLDKMFTEPEAPVSLHSELLKIEDRHGFSAAAMLKLRWIIVADEPAAKPAAAKSRTKSAKSQTSNLAARLKVVK